MATTLDPRSPEIRTDRGTVPARVGGLEEAEAAIPRPIKVVPQDAGSYLQLANAMESQGRLEEALEAGTTGG